VQMLQELRRYQCDEVQGFHFARPMPAAEMKEFLRRTRTM